MQEGGAPHRIGFDPGVPEIKIREGRMPSPIKENKVLIRRFFTAIESGDLRVFDEIVAEDYDDHLAGQSPGRETLKQYFTGLRSAFPDCNCRFRRSSPRATVSPF